MNTYRKYSICLIFCFRCPVNKRVITEFKYDESTGHADASLFSMFRLPDSRELHFQCDVAICKGDWTITYYTTTYEYLNSLLILAYIVLAYKLNCWSEN